MTRTVLSATIGKLLTDAKAMFEGKNDEYAGSRDDALIAFKELTGPADVSVLKVWLVLFGKGWAAIRTYLREAEAGNFTDKSESFRTRVLDAIAYLALLYCLWEDAKEEATIDATARRIVEEARTVTSSTRPIDWEGVQLRLWD